MRVLLVSQEFPPETGWGGIGTYAGIIAPALADAGAEVHVLSVVRHQQASDRIGQHGVHVHRRPLRRPPGAGQLARLPETWDRLSLAWAVAREVRRLQAAGLYFDVMECPEWKAEGLVLSRAARRSVPLVLRLHASAAQVYPYLGPLGPDRRLAVRLEDEAVRRADVVTGTNSQVAELNDRFRLDPDRVRAITYPVRPAPAQPPAPPAAAGGAPRICFAGRFEPRKGPETLLRALPLVRARVPGARLVLVGRDAVEGDSPSSSAALRALAGELGVADGLEIVERWGADAVAEEFGRAAVCAVPSRWESFGYVAAEAMALGRAVVASDIPPLAEVVVDGETGRLVPPGDAEAWAAALSWVLEEPRRARALGEAGLARITAVCAPEVVAAQTLDAYRHAMEVLGVRTGGGAPAVPVSQREPAA